MGGLVGAAAEVIAEVGQGRRRAEGLGPRPVAGAQVVEHLARADVDEIHPPVAVGVEGLHIGRAELVPRPGAHRAVHRRGEGVVVAIAVAVEEDAVRAIAGGVDDVGQGVAVHVGQGGVAGGQVDAQGAHVDQVGLVAVLVADVAGGLGVGEVEGHRVGRVAQADPVDALHARQPAGGGRGLVLDAVAPDAGGLGEDVDGGEPAGAALDGARPGVGQRVGALLVLERHGRAGAAIRAGEDVGDAVQVRHAVVGPVAVRHAVAELVDGLDEVVAERRPQPPGHAGGVHQVAVGRRAVVLHRPVGLLRRPVALSAVAAVMPGVAREALLEAVAVHAVADVDELPARDEVVVDGVVG
ncbi:MAG: hypothetical protein KC549_08150 [Myxococcales bacterium]|nr:hypothetical protein [Myxococcales bacterium]